jgi:hypothetical protein
MTTTLRCTCDPQHLDLGAYDPGCPIHPAATFPVTHGRASSRRRVLTFPQHLLVVGLILVAFALGMAVAR